MWACTNSIIINQNNNNYYKVPWIEHLSPQINAWRKKPHDKNRNHNNNTHIIIIKQELKKGERNDENNPELTQKSESM